MAARTEPLDLDAAARALAISRRTLRRWIRAGAPTVARGGRGRGRRVLLDPAAVRAWRASCAAPATPPAAVLALRLFARTADAIAEAHRMADGPEKRRAGAWMAAAWYAAACAVADELRDVDPDVRDPQVIPEAIARLRKAATA
jgi:hypothetical protein